MGVNKKIKILFLGLGILSANFFVSLCAMDSADGLKPRLYRQFNSILSCVDKGEGRPKIDNVKKQILEIASIQGPICQINDVLVCPELYKGDELAYKHLLDALCRLEQALNCLAQKRWEIRDNIVPKHTYVDVDICAGPFGVEIFTYPFGKNAEKLLVQMIEFRQSVQHRFERACE